MIKKISKTYLSLFILITLYLFLVLFFKEILNYDFFRSDVKSYWDESINWRQPYNEHVPLYTLIIALVRAITFNKIPPITLMMGINLISFSIGILLIFQIFQMSGINQVYSFWGTLLFGLWPFVGLTYTVDPLADMPAIAFTLAGFIMLQRSNHKGAALLFGLGIITHKGVWPIIGLVTLADFWSRKEFISRKNFQFLLIMLLPLFILWFAGSFHHNSANWLMSRSMQVNTSFNEGNHIFEGLIGTFQIGGIKGIIKGLIVLIFMLMSIGTLFTSLKYKFKNYELCTAISIAVLAMFIFSSSGTIWGPVRYSRFLVIPILLSVYTFLGEERRKEIKTIPIVLLFVGLYLTQLGFAWYMAKVFFA